MTRVNIFLVQKKLGQENAVSAPKPLARGVKKGCFYPLPNDLHEGRTRFAPLFQSGSGTKGLAYRRIVTLEKSSCLMGIGLRVTGRTAAIGSSRCAVLRRSVSVILIGSQGLRVRRTVTLEKSSRSQTSSSMIVESLFIVCFCMRVVGCKSFQFFVQRLFSQFLKNPDFSLDLPV
jgi:hypothetical protein